MCVFSYKCMQYLFNLFRSMLCGTVSNALNKSIIIISTYNLLLSDWARSCVVYYKVKFCGVLTANTSSIDGVKVPPQIRYVKR